MADDQCSRYGDKIVELQHQLDKIDASFTHHATDGARERARLENQVSNLLDDINRIGGKVDTKTDRQSFDNQVKNIIQLEKDKEIMEAKISAIWKSITYGLIIMSALVGVIYNNIVGVWERHLKELHAVQEKVKLEVKANNEFHQRYAKAVDSSKRDISDLYKELEDFRAVIVNMDKEHKILLKENK